MNLLSIGITPNPSDMKLYGVKHGLSDNSIANLIKFDQHFAKNHMDWFEKEFIKLQEAEKTKSPSTPIKWGRTRSSDQEFFRRITRYLGQCGSNIVLSFKEFMAWRCLQFGLQKQSRQRSVQLPITPESTSKPTMAQDCDAGGILIEQNEIIKAMAKKFKIPEKKMKKISTSMPSFAKDFVKQCLTCECHD